MTTRRMKVVGVGDGVVNVADGNDAQITAGWGNQIPGVLFEQSFYAPQVGDDVLVDQIGGTGAPYVAFVFTAGRAVPPDIVVPSLTVQSVAPMGANQLSAIYQPPDRTQNWIGVLATTPVPNTTPTTVVVSPVASRTWDPANNWRSDNTRVYQGSFGSGPCLGFWFYYGAAGNPFAGITGTVIRLQLTAHRYVRGGSFAGRQMHVHEHTYGSQPVGVPLMGAGNDPTGPMPSVDTTVTVDLPVAWAADLISGAAAGVGLTDGTASDYMIFDGPGEDASSGSLTFTTG